MTERLYYKDPTLLEFKATIVAANESDGLFRTRLDRSAFYPASGGQLYDLGMLNDVSIVEVIEDDAGEVWHITNKAVGDVGDEANGQVDEKRRWDNRQKHTAQHILSQAFIRLSEYETVSVHLGEEYASVELSSREVSQTQVNNAEDTVNQVILQNLPIDILFVDSDEAARLPLRKIPQRESDIRIIRIGDYDWSACGGTHCVCTAEIGLIKIIGSERIRDHSVIRFLAGRQAFGDYARRFEITDGLSRQLTCNFADLPDKFNKQAGEIKLLRKQVAELQRELLPSKVSELAASEEDIGGLALVVATLDSSYEAVAAKLATETACRITGIAVLVFEGRVIIASHSDCKIDAKTLAAYLSSRSDLKGGGKPALVQMGGGSKLPEEYAVLVRGVLADE